MRLPIIVLLVLLPLLPLAARAQPASQASDREQARAAYLRARVHHEEGRYTEALVELKRAYALQRMSVLLRYIADCYYAMRRYRLALDHYKLYLKRARYAPDKVQVGLRVRELEESLSGDEMSIVPHGPKAKLPLRLADGRDGEMPSDLQPPPASRPAPTGSGPAPRSKVLTIAKWSALGVSVAALAGGLTYNLLARSKAHELEDAVRTACPDPSPCPGNPDLAHPVSGFSPEQYELERTYRRYQNRSIAFLVSAGVAAAATLTLFVLDRRGRTAETRVSVLPMIGGVFAEASFP